MLGMIILLLLKSPTPVYLWINDDEVEIRDAGNIWGNLTRETEYLIRKELGDDEIQVMSIGPAGENMVRGAAIISGPGRSASGSGVGCVMGSKKLKAIAVRGHGSIRVAEPAKFIAVIDKIIKQVNASPNLQPWRRGIIEGKYLPEAPAWDVLASYRNGQDDYVPLEDRERLVGRESGMLAIRRR